MSGWARRGRGFPLASGKAPLGGRQEILSVLIVRIKRQDFLGSGENRGPVVVGDGLLHLIQQAVDLTLDPVARHAPFPVRDAAILVGPPKVSRMDVSERKEETGGLVRGHYAATRTARLCFRGSSTLPRLATTPKRSVWESFLQIQLTRRFPAPNPLRAAWPLAALLSRM